MDNIRRQATANKQLEILFKWIVLFLDNFAFLPRTSLEILNSLKLRYTKGGNRTMVPIIKTSVREMTMSFVEITYEVVCTTSNIARRVNSLRLVTDVR